MLVRCPHCQNPTDVDDDVELAEITCPSCGSSFSLVSETARAQPAWAETIGHFEIVEKLGTGAFGAVWKARDTKLDRTVAVKIPRKGQLDSDESEQFLREARAAAQLKHPNIVSIHEVGRTDETLYIVSDFVEGLNLSDWLTGRHLAPREAAQLCLKIADALHHAHEAGVVHRDLKPSNIMVETGDAETDAGTLEPHIMDFGLAKRETGEVTMTTDGQIMGTPAYMSPEQARGEAHDADRRSDIYSLGVIFFELLTGERPFRGNVRMLLHQVVHDEAPSPRKLNSHIPRDLETICLKCLEKQPERRYQTAALLMDDLQRWLDGRPIAARPIGRVGRSVRWCRRRPAVAALLALIVVVTAAGLTGISWKNRQLAAKNEALEQAVQAERQATEEADARRKEAETRLAQIQKGHEILGSIFTDLDPHAEKKEGKPLRVLLGERLDRAVEQLEGESIGDPLAVAALQNILGKSLMGLGYPGKAISLLTKAHAIRAAELGAEHPDTVASMKNLAIACIDAAKLDWSLPLPEQTLKIQEAKRRQDHIGTIAATNNLALAHMRAGKPDKAIPLFEQSLKLAKTTFGPEHPTRFGLLNNLIMAYRDADKLDQAIDHVEEMLKLTTARFGPTHASAFASMNDLASAYDKAGKLDQVLPLAASLLRAQPTETHARQILAKTCRKVGKLIAERDPKTAEALIRKATSLDAKSPNE